MHLCSVQALSQETGSVILLGTHLYPTMERTQIDLSEPALREWNLSCLRVASSVAMAYYTQHLKKLHASYEHADRWPTDPLRWILSSCAFERSAPNQHVGEHLKAQFLDGALPVPCGACTSI